MMRFPWVVIRRRDLLHLRGVQRSVSAMQSRISRHRDWNEAQQARLRKLKAQIATDQRYIDLLEEYVSAQELREARAMMIEERRAGSA